MSTGYVINAKCRRWTDKSLGPSRYYVANSIDLDPRPYDIVYRWEGARRFDSSQDALDFMRLFKLDFNRWRIQSITEIIKDEKR